jgi:hypothetical protein
MRLGALLLLAATAACPKDRELRQDLPRATEPAPCPAAEEACLNAWIAERGLNAFGDPPDQMYPGGTPLFDERTGTRLDRREHIYRRHPDARRACAPQR